MIIAWLKGDCTSVRLHAPPAPYILSSFLLFLFPSFCERLQGTVLELSRMENLPGTYPRGGYQSPSKKFWGQDPLGETFPQIFFRDIDLKIAESCPRPRKK